MKKRWIVTVVIGVALMSLMTSIEAKGRQGKGKNKPVWTPTTWQLSLPAIVVTESGKETSYAFHKLIEADGYLCPGSARVYQALRVGLPMLFEDGRAAKGQFKVLYGESSCATRVLDYFMGAEYSSKKYLEGSKDLPGRQIVIVSLTTNKRVTLTFDPPAADGHNTAGAAAGDVVLHAKEGVGLKVTTE